MAHRIAARPQETDRGCSFVYLQLDIPTKNNLFPHERFRVIIFEQNPEERFSAIDDQIIGGRRILNGEAVCR